MVLVAILEVRGNLRNADPLSHSFRRQNRLHLMLLSDRCHLNLRQCFVLVMMLSPDVSMFVKTIVKNTKYDYFETFHFVKAITFTCVTLSVVPASSACPNNESRSSALFKSCDDESRDRFKFSLDRLRSRPRYAAAAASNG